MEYKISVIVCTYNQEKTIGRTLDSILMQQCHVPYEIIIGEDCSTDGTLAICTKYAAEHSNIRIMASDKNKGVADNYFDCILSSKGQYIADCAGDDFWTDTQKLEKEVCIMEQHPDVTMVLTRWNWYDEDTQRLTPCPLPPYGEGIIKGSELLEHIVTQLDMSVYHLCTALYRAATFRQAYEENTFLFRNPEFGVEDIQVAYMMARYGNIAYLPDITLNYSVGKPSASQQTDYGRQFHFLRRVTDLCYYITETYQMHSQKIEEFFSKRTFALAMFAFRANSRPMFQKTWECKRKWRVPDNACLFILSIIMRYKPLWYISLLLRQLFIYMKRALH